MKIQTVTFTVAAALAAMLAFSGSGFAAPGGGNGGNGGGGDDGGGMEVPDYGDLIILYRDVDGVPIPSPVVLVEDPETDETVEGGLCWQPIAFEPETCGDAAIPLDVSSSEYLVPVDQYSCAVEAAYAGCTKEVDFGRINVARAPDDVFKQQLDDVIVNLATADCKTLDPAGRMVASRVADDGTVTSGAIDSPLQNLAIYRQLMLTGSIGTPLPQGASVLDTAARGLGAGSGKTGKINVDLVAYLNQIMGLTDKSVQTYLPKICITVREEVSGTVQDVEKCFLNYGLAHPDYENIPGTIEDPANYGYTRSTNFGGLPAPAYIDDPEGSNNETGWFEYLALVNPPLLNDKNLFEILQGPILTAVFAGEFGDTGGNIGGFAQAADDARAVINFMHDWPMPNAAVYATPVPCEASVGTAYDVSISEESGFQVPKNIVDGSSDREFIVNVANAGPDDATVTLTVAAIPDAGGTVEADLGAGFIPSLFEFPSVIITAGESHSFSALISVAIGQQTTINWTATAAAPDDVVLGNNTATAVSNVKVTGNGGQGGNPN